jgi:hypothetical protein
MPKSYRIAPIIAIKGEISELDKFNDINAKIKLVGKLNVCVYREWTYN